MKVPEGRPTIPRFNGGFRSLKPIESRRDERKHAFVRANSAAPSDLSRFVFTPTVKIVPAGAPAKVFRQFEPFVRGQSFYSLLQFGNTHETK